MYGDYGDGVDGALLRLWLGELLKGIHGRSDHPCDEEFCDEGVQSTLGDDPADLIAVEIEGLTWLESSPAVEVIAIDELGFPLMIVAPDPRAYICHKIWVSSRADRDPLKRYRDREQASGLCKALVTYLPDLRFDDPALHALPGTVREEGLRLAEQVKSEIGDPAGVGDWR